MVTLPNALSAFRILAAPVLLALAWRGAQGPFVVLLIAALLSDVVDGKVARWLGQCSDFGARLDSWGDLATYTTVPVCGLWLVPEVARAEAPFVVLVVLAYLVPIVVGFLKFRALTSYHTRGAVIGAYLLGGAAVVIFLGGPAWPLRVAAVVIALAELEELAITAVLRAPAINVRGLGAALAIARDQQARDRGAAPS